MSCAKPLRPRSSQGAADGGTALQLLLPLLAGDQPRTQLFWGVSPGTDVSHLPPAMM